MKYFFLFENSPKNLDLFHEMDLDILRLFGKKTEKNNVTAIKKHIPVAIFKCLYFLFKLDILVQVYAFSKFFVISM